MKPLLVLLFLLVATLTLIYTFQTTKPRHPKSVSKRDVPQKTISYQAKLQTFIAKAKSFSIHNGFSKRYQFLIDMRLASGKKRFFVYDAVQDSIVYKGLVAHGSCRTKYLYDAHFSNENGCGCSSVGRYKIGYAYNGQYGRAFKLFGLDSSNSNAFERNVVLHAYDCVLDEEVDPPLICNSLGCPMVSYKFLDTISSIINKSPKPILLWIYN